MSTEPTPAVERAAEAIYRRQAAEYRGSDFIPPWVELLVRDASAQPAYRADARAGLAAALDGPEPAQVLMAWDDRFLDEFDTGEPGRTELLLAMKAALTSNRRHRVRAIRAALLGEEAPGA